MQILSGSMGQPILKQISNSLADLAINQSGKKTGIQGAVIDQK